MKLSRSHSAAALAFTVTVGGLFVVSLSQSAGEAPVTQEDVGPNGPDEDEPRLQLLGTKAGTEYQKYAPTAPKSIFGYAMLSVPPNTVIDFAEDARDKLRHWGVAEEDIDNLLFTHSHFDHLDAPTVLAFTRHRWETFQRKTHAYASETVFAALRKASAEAKAEGFLELTKVTPGERIDLAKDVSATVLPSSHWTAPTPVWFLLEFHRKQILYAVDAAAFREDDLAHLKGRNLDVVIADCTYLDAEVDPRKSGHMNYKMVAQQMAELKKRGLATDSTPCYLTHLLSVDHGEQAPKARELGLIMAYDGLRIAFR